VTARKVTFYVFISHSSSFFALYKREMHLGQFPRAVARYKLNVSARPSAIHAERERERGFFFGKRDNATRKCSQASLNCCVNGTMLLTVIGHESQVQRKSNGLCHVVIALKKGFSALLHYGN
jgi:hypothetical protein